MHQYIRVLQNVVSRKGSSKLLTFSVPHVFKALRLLSEENYVSRESFCKNLQIGEGAVKTLINHLRDVSLVDSTKAGTFLTEKGKKFSKKIFEVLPLECNIKLCSVARAKYNHAIIIKKYANAIKTGVEQRDYAILYGAIGATTMLYENDRFVFPKENYDCLSKDASVKKKLREDLRPENGDVIIIASANDPFVAELSAKNAALWTVASHEKH
jgi:Mn-dependent DtxR family transcriptional regulator